MFLAKHTPLPPRRHSSSIYLMFGDLRFARNIKTPQGAIFGISGRKIQTLGVLAQASDAH
ncbi:MAG: hypothetical protein MPL62_08120 [Alphaproteobacteria bacterium]|nr:hypothetical protein [Alphaproteobacteria bacterium]